MVTMASAVALFLSALVVVVSSVPTNPSHKAALLDLWNVTGGDKWTVSNWNASTDPCNDVWTGIKCNDGQVFAITLQKNNLVGEVPASIAAITTLQFLYLSHNELSGSLPEELGSLRSLQQIGLDVNTFSGSLPASFSNLVQLQQLYIQDNLFEGGIDVLANATQLQYFYASHNRLSGTIPAAIGDFFALQQLGLDGNNFTGIIPATLGVSQNFLQSIYLQNNGLTGSIVTTSGICSARIENCDASGNFFACPVPLPACCRITYCQ